MWPGSGRSSTPRACSPGSKDSGRCIRYLTKYLTKHIGGCHQADTDAQADHAARLLDALRYEPCSPGVRELAALRHPAQERPRGPASRARARARPTGAENLGYAGRRVLVSRKWSGKTLADHRGDRKAWLMAMLDLPAPTTPAATGGNASPRLTMTS